MMSVKDFAEKQVVFVFPLEGESFAFKNDNIVVLRKDKSIKFQTTCYLLFCLFIVGSTSLTTPLIDKTKRFGFSIVLMNQNFRVITSINPKAEGNILLRSKQYSHSGDSVGAWIISNKIMNQLQSLKGIRKKDDELKEAICNLERYRLAILSPELSCQEIMGLEGAASRVYFRQMFKDYNWTARRPRVKHDEINCLLDIGYTMLFNLVVSLLEMYGFDLYVGVLHRPFFHRKSLACDIVEPFRPIIDKSIRKMANLGQIKKDDFYVFQNQYSLFGKNAIPYLKMLTSALMEYKSELYLYVQNYYRSFVRDMPVDSFPLFIWRSE